MRRRHFLQNLGAVSLALPMLDRDSAAGSGLPFPPWPDHSPDDPEMWKMIREQFVFPRPFSYFNTGGIGAVPAVVLNRTSNHADALEISPRPGHDEALWLQVKEKCAPLFGSGCRKEEFALVSTATEGIAIVVNGLPLRKGDEVITSTHEHPALNIALLSRMKRDGIVIKTFEPDLKRGIGNVERVDALMTRRTRLVFTSHTTCTTGQRFPEKALCDLARAKKVWIALDGAQVVGSMPIDVTGYGVHFYAISGHKWLLGPKRTGILYVHGPELETLTPMTVGAYSDSAHDILKQTLTFHPTAQRFEYATQNEALFFGLDTAIDFINAIGIPRIWAHNRKLAEQFCDGLRGTPNVCILSPEEPEYRTSMISFRIEHKNARDVAEALLKQQFRVRTVSEAGLNAIRVSMHVYNNEEEVLRLTEAVQALSA